MGVVLSQDDNENLDKSYRTDLGYWDFLGKAETPVLFVF